MPGKRIPDLDAIAGASTANDDNIVIYDTDAGVTKRILRSQLAAGIVGDLPLQYYLGVRTSAPTTRFNGDALQLGDYYLDSVSKYTTVYNGSGWNSYASIIAVQTAAEAARDAAQLAETNAETAETNAETAESGAVAQAGIATTQAGIATTQAGAAANSASTANSAKVAAEAARDAAVLGAPGVYATTAAGLAVVPVNGYFSVPSADSNETYILYRVDTGPVATEVKRYPSAALLAWTNEYRRTAGSEVQTEKVVEPSGSASNSVYRGLTVSTSDVIDVWLTVKAAGRMMVNLYNNGGATMDVRIDLERGTTTNATPSFALDSHDITPLGNDWWLVHVVKTVAAGGTGNLQFRLYGVGGTSNPYGTSNYTGDGVSGAFVDSLLVYNRTTATYPFPSARLSDASWTKLNSTVVAATVTNENTLGGVVAQMQNVLDEYSRSLSTTFATRKITEDSGSVSPSCYTGFSWVNTGVYDITVVAKAGERTKLNFYSNAGALFDATFDLVAETISGLGANVKFSFTRLGNGWYQAVLRVTATQSAGSNLQIRMLDAAGNTTYTGDGTSGFFVDSIRLSSSSNTSHLQSTDPANAVWLKQGVTVSGATATSALGATKLANLVRVFGEATGDKFVEGSGASQSPSVYRSYSFTSGTAYTFGGDFKADERTRVNLYCNGGALFGATFDLENGVVESGSGATITALSDGWYRCQQTVTATASTAANLQIRVYPATGGHPYTGDGVSGIFANDAYLTAGGANLLTDSSAFSGGAWNLQNVSVLPDVALFGGTGYVGGGSVAPYVDPGVTAWLGKKVSVIGTSITAQAQYTVPLAAALGVTLVNLGTSGGSLASGSHYGSLYIYNAIASIPSDSDVVIVEAGTNDFGTDNSTLGALGDTTTATFYGAIFAACAAIRTQAPNAKIVFLTPYSGDSRTSTHRILRTNTKGYTLDQFQNAVAEGAGYCGFAWIDVGRQSGIGYHTGTIYLGDGLHLNSTGGVRFANYVAEQLRVLGRSGYLGT